MEKTKKNTITIYDCINQYQEKKYIKNFQNCQKCKSNVCHFNRNYIVQQIICFCF